jgi:hypothetical protein
MPTNKRRRAAVHNHSHADHHRRAWLTRRQKNITHGLLLACLCLALFHEGAAVADWLFLVLAVAVEVS